MIKRPDRLLAIRAPDLHFLVAGAGFDSLWKLSCQGVVVRTIDRVEAMIVGGLAVTFLAAAPLSAVAAWHTAYSMGSRVARTQQAAWHQVPAVPARHGAGVGLRRV
jgi:hypothetical protein